MPRSANIERIIALSKRRASGLLGVSNAARISSKVVV